MKKFLVLLLLVFVSFNSVALAKKIKIARLPIIIQKNILDEETSASLEMKMARAANIPMNKTLKIADYVSPKESARVLEKIWKEMYAQEKNPKLSDAVKILADDMNADLIICPVLHQYSQKSSSIGFNVKNYLSTTVSAELIVYDRTTGDLIDKRTSRRFNDNFNRFGTASYLSGECFDQLIKDTELREIIRSKKG